MTRWSRCSSRSSKSASGARSSAASRPQIPTRCGTGGDVRRSVRMAVDDARRARHHDRAAGRARAGGEQGRPVGDPCLPPGRDPARAERAAGVQPRAAVRGDGLRRRDRARLPALLPRSRVQPGAPHPQRSPRADGGAADLAVNGRSACWSGGCSSAQPGRGGVAAAVYVSSSAIAVKALADFRRLADDETDLVLAILLFEDVVVAVLLGFVASGGGGLADSAASGAGACIRRRLPHRRALPRRPLGRLLARLDLEFFLLAVFGFVIGMAALATLGMSDAVGALMAGVVLSDSGVRQEIEERFFALRDVFAALFFFVFGLAIDLSALDDLGWVLASASCSHVVGKIGVGVGAGVLGGFTAPGLQRRRGAGGTRRVHDHHRAARSSQRRHLHRRPRRDRRLRRPLRAADRHNRSRADEGVSNSDGVCSGRA